MSANVKQALENLVRDCLGGDFNEHHQSYKDAQTALLPEPVPQPKCCVCKTTVGLFQDGWYGWRCKSTDCMVF